MPYDAEGLASLSLTLGVVVVLLWGTVWALRRARGGGFVGGGARDCAVLRSLVLGPRERLVVVRVGTRQLVVGVGSAAVSLLCELDEPLPPALAPDGFGMAVRKAVERWRGE